MLYLGIDLHSKQFTVNLRDEQGEVVLRRQVSTRGEEPRKFLEEVARRAGESGYVAILEVCGFHDWLTELLPQCGCRQTILIQPKERSRRKSDRRDASQLSETLWSNRHRLLQGLKVNGLRQIVPPTPQERDDRRLTELRRQAGAELTRTINAVQYILRRRNLGQFCPTKGTAEPCPPARITENCERFARHGQVIARPTMPDPRQVNQQPPTRSIIRLTTRSESCRQFRFPKRWKSPVGKASSRVPVARPRVARCPDWSGLPNRDDRKKLSVQALGLKSLRLRRRIHEGMDRGAVGLGP